MKKTITYLFFVLMSSTLSAQNPINVIITGECFEASSTYIYNGVVNGKNNYTKTFDIDGETIVIGVGFDNSKWVLYADGDLTDDGFSNIAVPNGLVPPSTGWVNTGCLDGTMIIEELLSISSVAKNENRLIIYPNPSNNIITIQDIENSQNNFIYKIVDLTGRIIKKGKSTFNGELNISALNTGNYIIELETENGERITKKLVKK